MEFATKPELARQMIHTALEHVPGAWVAGDEVYGRNPGLRSYLEQQRMGYVMEMAATDGELAFFCCYVPRAVPLSRLVAVAGRRWRVEGSFQQGTGLAGLDEHQVRGWRPWHRWSLLVMVAHAFLAVCRLRELARHRPASGLVALSCNEIARLLHALFSVEHGLEHALGRSVFRRARQGRAQRCHHRRQAVLES